MVGVAGTAAGVVFAVIREKIDRMSDARIARQAAEEQRVRDLAATESVENEPGESGSGEAGPDRSG
jgi:hypothetical protein